MDLISHIYQTVMDATRMTTKDHLIDLFNHLGNITGTEK